MAEMEKDMMEFNSEEEMYAWAMSQVLPEAEGEELPEESLELVTGGVSTTKAIQIVTTAYWDLCVLKKKKTKYKDTEIFDAIKKINKNLNSLGDGCTQIIKWGVKVAEFLESLG